MPTNVIRYFYIVALLTHNLATCSTTGIDDDHDDNESRRTFPFRRAIDGTRGRKFYDAEDDGFVYAHGSSGRYDPDHHANDFTDIRNNVPGEPGVDYPSYTRLPQTGFACQADYRGYYADEIAGCQVFHVCDGTFLVSSFLCPIGSVFSQKFLTCDWWTKVDCSSTRNYHAKNLEDSISSVDDDEILRKAFEMSSVKSAGERIPSDTFFNSNERKNDFPIDTNDYTDYTDYTDFSNQPRSRFHSRPVDDNRKRYRDGDEHIGDATIQVHTIGKDRNDERLPINDFRPSYAPTVPTVITTTRRFYSPTFPTTYKPPTDRPTARRRYDLEFESSDHLYTAKGRTIGNPKTVTPASKFYRSRDDSTNIAELVNSAVETSTKIENMQESASLHYSTTNYTKNRYGDGNVTFAISTIDDENSNDPERFFYDREDETRSNNEEKVEIVKTLADRNFTDDRQNRDEIVKISTFLKPPRKDVEQFRITVLDQTENLSKTHKSKGLHLNDSRSVGRLEDVPNFGREGDARESRVIRIYAGNGDSNNDFLETIGIDSSRNKIGNDISDKTETFSKQFPDDVRIEKTNENENLTIGKETKKNSDSIGEIDAAVILNEFRFNSTTEHSIESIVPSGDVKKIDDHEKSAEKSVTTLKNNSAPKNITNDVNSNDTDDTSTDKTIFSREKITDHTIGSENILLNAKTAISHEKIGDYAAIPTENDEISTNDEKRNLKTNDTDNDDRSIIVDRLEKNIGDSIVEGSSPFEVTLTLNKNDEFDPNGEIIRELIAKQEIGDAISRDDHNNFDIVRSNSPEAPEHRTNDFTDDRHDDSKIGKKPSTQIDENRFSNHRGDDGRSSTDYRSLISLIRGPNLSRPFEKSVSSSKIGESTSVDEIAKDAKSKHANDRQFKLKKESLMFELPQVERSFDFASDRRSVMNFDRKNDRDDDDDDEIVKDEESTTASKIGEKSVMKTVVETELVRSLSFGLNTDDEREKYMDAVFKGLLPDIRAHKSMNNDENATTAAVGTTDQH